MPGFSRQNRTAPVGDLEEDTAVERVANGRYRAVISPDWALWGPVGGYVAAIALRAAGAHAGMPLPASFSCQYLSPARFGPVDLEVTCLRSTPNARSANVLMTQQGTAVMSALVWAITDDIRGPERQMSVRPDVPDPHQVAEIVLDRRVASSTAAAATATGTFWQNLEVRKLPPVRRPDGFQGHSWARFRPRAYFNDPWIDAGRELISIDSAIFPVIATALGGGRYAALSIDLYVAFHAPPPAEDYLLVTAHSTAAGAGLVAGTAQVRSADGTLTASGGSQLMCRMLSR
jgi:acyl-CoA thioesterase